MTRTEAIVQLRLGPGINEDVSEEYNDAVNMAIEALKTQARPIICPRCGRTFSESEGREER